MPWLRLGVALTQSRGRSGQNPNEILVSWVVVVLFECAAAVAADIAVAVAVGMIVAASVAVAADPIVAWPILASLCTNRKSPPCEYDSHLNGAGYFRGDG